MIIKIYDDTLDLQGVIDDFISLLWTRKYFEPGNFELQAPMTDSNRALLARGNLVSHGQVEAGVIEAVAYEESPTTAYIKATGRFLSSYMDRRLVQGVYSFSGLVESAMRDILDNATAIPLVQEGTTQGFADTVDFQVTYKNLLTVEQNLGKGASMGFRFTPDFTNKTITFDIYKGTDHSINQTVNPRVFFSDAYDNLDRSLYSVNDQLYKSVVYVLGENDRIETVGSATGLECREIFVDATDIQSSDMTADEYTAALQQRGNEALENALIAESFECDTEATANFTYRTDYDLGDIVTVQKKDWGISMDLRITEIQEIYENGESRVTPVFGNPLPEVINWEV